MGHNLFLFILSSVFSFITAVNTLDPKSGVWNGENRRLMENLLDNVQESLKNMSESIDNDYHRNLVKENPKLGIRNGENRRLVEKLHDENQKPLKSVSESSDNEYRRNFIKEMMKHAWSNYKTYAWGQNELKPVSKVGHSGSVFGSAPLGATIIDAADTLHIMGLMKEFGEARDWIAQNLDMKKSGKDMSVFETNIRYVGGLLSAYALTSEQMFLEKARQVADLLLPAFNTPTGIPMAQVNMQTGHSSSSWSSCSILSEFGTMELEFTYLSELTGNPIYREKASRIRFVLDQVEKPDGLYSNYVNPETGMFCQRDVSVGALGDSFYEYLLKVWLFTNKTDDHLKVTYDDTVTAIEKHLLQKSEKSHLTYFAELHGSSLEHKMGHLACFIAGMFALQSKHETNPERQRHYLELAEQIANTCHESYVRSDSGIGPECMRFSSDFEATTSSGSDSYYILRPEVVEGWFVLYRITGNQKYRDWCWTAARAIQTHCKVDGGYSGIKNVYAKNVTHDDVQQSFFLAETLKYLYLVFSEPGVISLDKWVFNTEAHPFPIKTIQPLPVLTGISIRTPTKAQSKISTPASGDKQLNAQNSAHRYQSNFQFAFLALQIVAIVIL